MNAPAARKRKAAGPQATRFVRASVTVDAALHAAWSAAASLSGMDRNAFAVEALKKALEGIVVVDRRKPSDRLKNDDRLDQRIERSSDQVEAA